MKITILLVISNLILYNTFAQNAPAQPSDGPGGNLYLHDTVTFTKFGSDITDCYWIMEPDNPRPDSAVVIVYWHGTNSNTNIDGVPAGHYLTLQHICKKGYTIIYPLYQYGGQTLPFQQQLTNGANVVNMALSRLDTAAGRVRPKRNGGGKILLGATGISRGGGMTVNVATHHITLGLPSFDALCPVVPGAGQPMTGIDITTKIIVLNGEENTTNFYESQELFDSLYHIPCTNKHLIQINSDYYGTPDLIADHNFAGSGHDPADSTALNTLDFYGMWKFAVGVFDCAFKNIHCEYCFGTDTLVTYMGHWSDGTPVIPATIVDTCGNIPVGIYYHEEHDSEISVYPNPATNLISISGLPDNFKGIITIYNTIGQIVLSENKAGNQFMVDVSDLKMGIYLVQLNSGNGIIISRKFFKE